MLNLPVLLSTSDETRAGSVSALANQYQRMAQAKPLLSPHGLNAMNPSKTGQPSL